MTLSSHVPVINHTFWGRKYYYHTAAAALQNTEAPGHIWGVGKLQVCPDSQIQRRSLFYWYWIYYQLDWCIFVSFVQLDVAYVWRQINAKIIDHWVALCGRKTAVGCLFACSSKAKKKPTEIFYFLSKNSRKRLHVL